MSMTFPQIIKLLVIVSIPTALAAISTYTFLSVFDYVSDSGELFNFIHGADLSGLLVFIGIAAGINFNSFRDRQYKSIIFMYGLMLAIVQLLAAYMDPLILLDENFCFVPAKKYSVINVLFIHSSFGVFFASMQALLAHEREVMPKIGPTLKSDGAPLAPFPSDQARLIQRPRYRVRPYPKKR